MDSRVSDTPNSAYPTNLNLNRENLAEVKPKELIKIYRNQGAKILKEGKLNEREASLSNKFKDWASGKAQKYGDALIKLYLPYRRIPEVTNNLGDLIRGLCELQLNSGSQNIFAFCISFLNMILTYFKVKIELGSHAYNSDMINTIEPQNLTEAMNELQEIFQKFTFEGQVKKVPFGFEKDGSMTYMAELEDEIKQINGSVQIVEGNFLGINCQYKNWYMLCGHPREEDDKTSLAFLGKGVYNETNAIVIYLPGNEVIREPAGRTIRVYVELTLQDKDGTLEQRLSDAGLFHPTKASELFNKMDPKVRDIILDQNKEWKSKLNMGKEFSADELNEVELKVNSVKQEIDKNNKFAQEIGNLPNEIKNILPDEVKENNKNLYGVQITAIEDELYRLLADIQFLKELSTTEITINSNDLAKILTKIHFANEKIEKSEDINSICGTGLTNDQLNTIYGPLKNLQKKLRDYNTIFIPDTEDELNEVAEENVNPGYNAWRRIANDDENKNFRPINEFPFLKDVFQQDLKRAGLHFSEHGSL